MNTPKTAKQLHERFLSTIKTDANGSHYIHLGLEGYDELELYVFALSKSTELLGVALEDIATWGDNTKEIGEVAHCLQYLSRLSQKLRLYGEFEALDQLLEQKEQTKNK